MKKLLVFFIVLSFLVPSVFADLTVKGNAYGQLNVLQVYDDQTEADNDDVFAKLGRGDDNGDGVRTRVDLTGSAGEGLAGYRLQLNWHTEPGTVSIGDFAYGWVKPLGNDLLQVNFGKFAGDAAADTLRGKQGGAVGAYGSYAHNDAISGTNDVIFRRFTGDATGLALISKPITGLTIGFGVKDFAAFDVIAYHQASNGHRSVTDADKKQPVKAGTQWEQFHLAAGYDISGIGLARVGFLAAGKDSHQNSYTGGNARGIPYSSGTDSKGFGTLAGAEISFWGNFPTGHLIQAAFQLKALESTGLSLDFGFGLPIAYTVAADNAVFWGTSFDPTKITGLNDVKGKTIQYWDWEFKGNDTTFQAPLNLSLGAKYTIGDFGIGFRTDLFFAGSVKAGDADQQALPLTLYLHLNPSYAIQNIGTVGLDFGFNAYGPVTRAKNVTGKEEDLSGGIQNLGFGGYYQKTIAGGTFRIGLGYIVPLAPVGSYVGATDDELDADAWDKQNTPGIFTIPVTLEFSF
jgi:hypothetical protein